MHHVNWAAFLQSFEAEKSNSLTSSKTFVKCTFALDAFFHAAINVEKMVEGLYPALMARIPICHPPSGQSTSS